MGAPRSYRVADIKKLFALSYNQCALTGCDERLADPSWPSVLAELCHIYGLNPGSARYLEGLTTAEANSVENLILLCRNCHQKVDVLHVDDYPAERLLEIKQAHEKRQSGNPAPWCDDETLAYLAAQLAAALGFDLERPPPPAPAGGQVVGRVKFFNSEKGYGFISVPGEDDVFVHFTNIVGSGYKTLDEGDEVEFTRAPGRRGDEAQNVVKR